ncbi:MAG: Asp-tRNA(Asn)/Glu-tRNA(Gln) amidotransferase subunit GatC [Atopobiaceae bacterium]|nr:Asp-tRNA(Asn)/Glu-tRNA(Gln) amidotransferase subunit GatC [Atopobiaceae bacterium]
MALTREDVRGIAEYARIALSEQELDEMTSYLNEAVELLEPIRAYDLSGIDPTFHPIGDLTNVMASDEPDAHGRSLDLEVALGNAVSTRGRAFRVPSILGDTAEKGAGAEGGDR